MTVPVEGPASLDIPAAWIGSEIATIPDQWRWSLSATEVGELEEAAQQYLSAGGTLAELSPENFVIPGLRPKLERVRDTLIHGIGFEVIRGLPVDRLGDALASTIFCGIGAYLGRARSQNAKGTCSATCGTLAPIAAIPTRGSIRPASVRPSTPTPRTSWGCCA